MTPTRVSPLLLFFLVSHSVTTDEFLGPIECLERKFTRESCDLVFCRPWEYCVDGRCSCKPAYLCPAEGVASVCGHDNRQLRSYCQAMAVSCQTHRTIMSHFGETCSADQPKFRGSVESGTGVVQLFVPDTGSTGGGGQELLVCPELWDMSAANVACKANGHPLGASSSGTVSHASLPQRSPGKCVSVRCQGYENSLAECVIYDKTAIDSGDVATATCVQPPECRDGAFRCSSGVCLHGESVGDGQIDCLDGEDESEKHTKTSLPLLKNTEYISPKSEMKDTRVQLESRLNCGIPNRSRVDDGHEVERGTIGRFKRVVGGTPTYPTQIQWQAAISMKRFHCGGAFIGGCWVITVAHCFGRINQKPDMSSIVVSFSLWKRAMPQGSTDIAPVHDVHIHPKYNPDTLENDIALVQLEKLPFQEECLQDNPVITPVCVPWTTRLFNPNHTCTVSGWGEPIAGGRMSQVLQWASMSLIEDCHRFHNDSIKPGMICADDQDGRAGACEGDNGGPLVCEDELGVSYLWGVVSWGKGCGQPGSPDVYTQVAHYFEWIRLHTGWSAVTKFNA
ncbi:complement factor I-like isoform X2 [Anoplopoma fimbria]|uniref:complement factor I-like isoform X2 n=1 Tax=Anoplopoma fimbria TaxID=229290 RepID=UPI0023EB02D0|nr:complement factor I-like isoform X2 [Anoplopoma fimbria]